MLQAMSVSGHLNKFHLCLLLTCCPPAASASSKMLKDVANFFLTGDPENSILSLMLLVRGVERRTGGDGFTRSGRLSSNRS